MLQLVIWILCFYLVVKGYEVYLIAATSDREKNAGHVSTAQ